MRLAYAYSYVLVLLNEGQHARRKQPIKMKTRYIIRSTERNAPHCYFAAIHGYSPFFSSKEKARRFDTEAQAEAYALAELFTVRGAFEVEEVID